MLVDLVRVSAIVRLGGSDIRGRQMGCVMRRDGLGIAAMNAELFHDAPYVHAVTDPNIQR